MLNIRDAYIDVFKPANNSDTPDYTVPARDIEQVDASVRAGQRKDSGKIVLDNSGGAYTSGAKPITTGDRLVFWVTVKDDILGWGTPARGWSGTYGRFGWGGEGDGWGDNHGQMAWGGSTPTRAWGAGTWGGRHDRWTAMVRDRTAEYVSPSRSTLTLACEDFVSAVAAKRLVFNIFSGAPLSGSPDAIVDTILDNEAPEIDQSRIDTFSQTTNMNLDGVTVLDALQTAADRADAVMRGRKTGLVFEELAGISSKFDLAGDEIGRLKTQESDQGLMNEVRVDGGTATDQDASQTTQTAYATVTNTSRETFRVDTRKSQIAELEVWTQTTGSGESVTVRLQKDDGGSPVDVSSSKSDIDSVTLSSEFLDDDGWTTFQFGEHTLPEPRPWVIIQTDGGSGQKVGTDSNGNVAYKSKYPYQITVRDSSQASINAYRRREERIKAKSVQSFDEADEIVTEALDHESVPEQTVEAPADSIRTHRLSPLEAVSLDFPRELATGDYLVVERSDTYDGVVVESTLTLQEISSL